MPSFEDLHYVTIRVGGRDFGNWKSNTISYGIETAARSFAISATQPPPAEGDAGTESPISDLFVGDAVEVFVGRGTLRQRLITGYIDSLAPSYSAETGLEVAVSGRSKTCDAVDCAAIGSKRFNELKIEKIASRLASPYGISVVTDLPPGETTGKRLKKFVVEQGETVYSAIERMARLRFLLITDNADGELVLIKAAPGSFPLQIGSSLELGRNVLDADATFDGSDLFSEYQVRSQTAGNDQDFGEVVTGIQATALEGGIGRRRVHVISSESSANKARCLARAKWEATTRLGRSTLANFTVRGWYDDNGDLWQPGVLVDVRDDFLRINRELLIVNVDLTVDDQQGHVAKLLLAPEGGYYAALPESPRAGLGAWKS